MKKPKDALDRYIDWRETKEPGFRALVKKNRAKVEKEFKQYRLSMLKEVIGVGAFRSLKTGKGILKVWRNSTPHNWWVEGSRGKQLWHSGEWGRPNLELFDNVYNSKEVVTYPQSLGIFGRMFFSSDAGLPMESHFKLKRIYRTKK